MHSKRLPQQVRLVAPPALQAVVLGAVEVVLQDRPVLWMRSLLDDFSRTLLGRQTADVSEALWRKSELLRTAWDFEVESSLPVQLQRHPGHVPFGRHECT